MIVACGQMQAHTLAESTGVWSAIERLANQARLARADMLVLPEATYPAYWLGSREAYEAAGLLDSQEVLSRFGDVGRTGGFWLVVGFVEAAYGKLFNSAAVIDRGGRIVGIARKSFLWDCDNRWFSPADQLSMFDTELGRMGVLICADGRAPEITATLVAGGAEFMVMPTAWVNAAKGTGRVENPQAEYLIRARAREFAVPFACANKSGREADKLEYVGQSQFVDAQGNMTAVAPIDGEYLVVDEISPRRARSATVSAEQRMILGGPGVPSTRDCDGPHVELSTTTTPEEIKASVRGAGGRVSVLVSADLSSFVAARCAALAGVQILVIDGGESGGVGGSLLPTESNRVTADPGSTLLVFARARAMENRVFVVMANANGPGAIIAPSGHVIWRRGGPDTTIRLNLGLANDKHVTRETDIWEQRRVASYLF